MNPFEVNDDLFYYVPVVFLTEYPIEGVALNRNLVFDDCILLYKYLKVFRGYRVIYLAKREAISKKNTFRSNMAVI